MSFYTKQEQGRAIHKLNMLMALTAQARLAQAVTDAAKPLKSETKDLTLARNPNGAEKPVKSSIDRLKKAYQSDVMDPVVEARQAFITLANQPLFKTTYENFLSQLDEAVKLADKAGGSLGINYTAVKAELLKLHNDVFKDEEAGRKTLTGRDNGFTSQNLAAIAAVNPLSLATMLHDAKDQLHEQLEKTPRSPYSDHSQRLNEPQDDDSANLLQDNLEVMGAEDLREHMLDIFTFNRDYVIPSLFSSQIAVITNQYTKKYGAEVPVKFAGLPVIAGHAHQDYLITAAKAIERLLEVHRREIHEQTASDRQIAERPSLVFRDFAQFPNTKMLNALNEIQAYLPDGGGSSKSGGSTKKGIRRIMSRVEVHTEELATRTGQDNDQYNSSNDQINTQQPHKDGAEFERKQNQYDQESRVTVVVMDNGAGSNPAPTYTHVQERKLRPNRILAAVERALNDLKYRAPGVSEAERAAIDAIQASAREIGVKAAFDLAQAYDIDDDYADHEYRDKALFPTNNDSEKFARDRDGNLLIKSDDIRHQPVYTSNGEFASGTPIYNSQVRYAFHILSLVAEALTIPDGEDNYSLRLPMNIRKGNKQPVEDLVELLHSSLDGTGQAERQAAIAEARYRIFFTIELLKANKAEITDGKLRLGEHRKLLQENRADAELDKAAQGTGAEALTAQLNLINAQDTKISELTRQVSKLKRQVTEQAESIAVVQDAGAQAVEAQAGIIHAQAQTIDAITNQLNEMALLAQNRDAVIHNRVDEYELSAAQPQQHPADAAAAAAAASVGGSGEAPESGDGGDNGAAVAPATAAAEPLPPAAADAEGGGDDDAAEAGDTAAADPLSAAAAAPLATVATTGGDFPELGDGGGDALEGVLAKALLKPGDVDYAAPSAADLGSTSTAGQTPVRQKASSAAAAAARANRDGVAGGANRRELPPAEGRGQQHDAGGAGGSGKRNKRPGGRRR